MRAAERQRQQDTQVLLDSIAQRPPGALLLTTEPTTAEAEVLAQLQAVTARQNERDAALDAQDLRQVLRGALQANSDAEMIRTLQVGRDEMPEAIKTLQRALEKEVERESVEGEPVLADANAYTDAAAAAVPVSLARSATTASAGSHTTSSSAATGHSRGPRDTLDREFIETGIDALRRLSGAEVTLPSWTITRYEVNRDEKIGMGGFSDVYKGTWRERVVAIKVLAPTTPRQLFVHEVSGWFSRGYLPIFSYRRSGSICEIQLYPRD